jgi:hypothetical protein
MTATSFLMADSNLYECQPPLHFVPLSSGEEGVARSEKRWLYIRWTDSHLFSHGCEKRGGCLSIKMNSHLHFVPSTVMGAATTSPRL